MEDELRKEIMKVLGSSINFKGLADEWYIKHCEDVDQILALINKQVIEARINQLDEFTKRWNNYIGDMPDKEKEKLGYLELTGMVWGIVSQFRIPLEELKDTLKDKEGE